MEAWIYDRCSDDFKDAHRIDGVVTDQKINNFMDEIKVSLVD